MEKLSIYDLGYSRLITKDFPLEIFDETEGAPSSGNLDVSTGSSWWDSVSPGSISGGELTGNLDIVSGYLESENYVAGSAGWQLTPTTAEFPSITVSGGTIKYNKTSFTDTTNAGYYICSDGFYFGSASDATKLKFTISNGEIDFVGASISNPVLTGIQAGSELAIQGWTHDMAFTPTDHDTVAWASGTIALTDGTTFSIDAGNTGAMSAITYIYFSKADSETVLQTTTTYSTAIGSNKILICTAEDVVAGKKAIFQVFGGNSLGGTGKLLVADNIAANSITANLVGTNEIIANSANIASAVIGDAHITGTITVGKTDAKCTDANADQTSANTSNDTSNVNGLSSSSVSGWAHGSDTTKIDGGDIYTNTITATQIAANTITASEIGAGAVTAEEIAAGTITATHIDSGTITTTEIAANTITAGDIAANTITASEIAVQTITATEIAVNTITATQIAANTITATELNVTTLSAISANMGTLTAGAITGGTIDGVTITGATIRTASSGPRAVMGTSNFFHTYDANHMRIKLDTDTLHFYDANGNEAGNIIGGTATIYVYAKDNSYVHLGNGTQGTMIAVGPNVYTTTIKPFSDNTYSLGTSSLEWKTLYVNNLGGSTTIDGNFYVATTGNRNIGSATNYFNGVNAKVYNDRSGVFKTDVNEAYNLIKNIEAEETIGHCRMIEKRGQRRIKLRHLPKYMWDDALEPAKEDIIFDDNTVIDNQIDYQEFAKGEVIAKKGEKTRWRTVKDNEIRKGDEEYVKDNRKHIIEAAEGLELTALISHIVGCEQKIIEKLEAMEIRLAELEK